MGMIQEMTKPNCIKEIEDLINNSNNIGKNILFRMIKKWITIEFNKKTRTNLIILDKSSIFQKIKFQSRNSYQNQFGINQNSKINNIMAEKGNEIPIDWAQVEISKTITKTKDLIIRILRIRNGIQRIINMMNDYNN